MKTVAEPTFVQTSNVGETKQATIKASAKIFNFFADQIYSDKFTAILRELVANAIDGQKVNGDTRSPIVTLPSILEPHMKVRDFGCSMSHEFMMNKFMAFTDASTKEQSNEFIGGFGIGSKAPLAYTDQFSIRCFMGGTVRVYSVFKDAEGCPSIAFLAEHDTDEPDGVEVGFPVRQDDIHSFTSVAVKTLQYFNPLPVLENTELKLEPVVYDAKGTKWGIRVASNNRQPNLIIGGVSYRLDVGQIPYSYQDLRAYAGLGLDIYLEIGDANISLSRESVTHDEALFARLSSIITGIKDEFEKQMSAKFAAIDTLWEAKTLLENSVANADYATANMLRRHANYKGVKFDSNVTRPAGFEVLIIPYGDFSRQYKISGMPITQALSPKWRAWTEYGSFSTTAFDRIVIDDVPIADKPAARVRAVIEKHGGRILFLRWNDQDPNKKVDWAGYLAALGSPPKSMIEYLSSYQPVKIARAKGSGVSRQFKCYVGENRPYRSKSYSTQLPAGGGMYVEMDNFYPCGKGDVDVALMTKPKNVVWLNKTDFISSGISKMPEWSSVEELTNKAKSDYAKKHPRMAMAHVYSDWKRMGYRNPLCRKLTELSKLSNFPKRGPLVQLLKLSQEFEPVSSADHHQMRKLLGVEHAKETKEFSKLLGEIDKKYPLLMEVVKGNFSVSARVLNALF